MAFEIDIGFASQAGKKDINEDFVAAMLPDAGHEALGAIAAIAEAGRKLLDEAMTSADGVKAEALLLRLPGIDANYANNCLTRALTWANNLARD